MKIAVVGCGALGGFYGARLCRTPHQVYFLSRSDYEVVRHHGVQIQSIDGDFTARPLCARTPQEIGPADLVLIGLKTTANRTAFPTLLPPLVAPHTVLLSLQNGLGDEEELAALFPPAQVMGGLCFVCLNRVRPGVVRHTAHGLVVLGEHLGPPSSRTERIANLLRESGTPCRITPNLARAHWEKLVWNIPFNGLGVAAVAGLDAVQTGRLRGAAPGTIFPTDALLADPRWETLVRELMAEVVAAANACGFQIDPSVIDHQVERTRVMGDYRASTLIDFEQGRELELDHLFREPLRRGKAAGVPMPRLSALCQVLEQLIAQPRTTSPEAAD